MKMIAFSDTHGNRRALRDAVEQSLAGAPIDICVHCGDGARDMESVEPLLREGNPDVRLYTVRGNGDMGAFQYPTLELFDAGGLTVMATHGHLYNVKSEYESLLCAAQSHQAKIAFFGHTHKPFLEAVRGVYLINPGSVAYRVAGNVAYAQVLIDATGTIHADLMRWRT